MAPRYCPPLSETIGHALLVALLHTSLRVVAPMHLLRIETRLQSYKVMFFNTC